MTERVIHSRLDRCLLLRGSIGNTTAHQNLKLILNWYYMH